ncbi:MAG: homoserine kinase [Thiothrix nivea]|nr:MAG: homoserine kinase [Thiothrix nivea]
MSVFTVVSRDDLSQFISGYAVGKLLDYAGIAAGAENTNYFVTTSVGQYVLTLFEKHRADELTFYLDLMQHLALAEIPVAHPVIDLQGRALLRLKGKPAVLFERLPGATESVTTLAACAAIGEMLARIHLATTDFTRQRFSERGHGWRIKTAEQLLGEVSAEDAVLLQQEITFQQKLKTTGLLQGVIHADLFLDNALFDQGQLSGVVDWYYACNDYWLYDLAVVVNDWCCQTDGALDEYKLKACLQAYHHKRPLTAAEFTCWPGLLRAAALRFWLSRLLDKLHPRAGDMVLQKNPDEFKNKLLLRIQETDMIRSCWPVGL